MNKLLLTGTLAAGLLLSGCQNATMPSWLGGNAPTSTAPTSTAQTVCQKAEATVTTLGLAHEGAAHLLQTAAENNWIHGANATTASKLLTTTENELDVARADSKLCKPIADQIDTITSQMATVNALIPNGAPK